MKKSFYALPLLILMLTYCTTEFDEIKSPEELFGGTSSSDGNSCSSDGNSSSDGGDSSSSSGPSGPGQNPEPEYPDYECGEGATFIDNRDSKEYLYAVANGKAWMLDNLNYSEGETKGWCWSAELSDHSDNTNCDTRGRYYDWATLLNLPEKCNSASSDPTSEDYDSDCAIEDEHQGVCPKGWHVAGKADWDDFNGITLNALSLNGSGNYDVGAGSWSNNGYNFFGVPLEGSTAINTYMVYYNGTGPFTIAVASTGNSYRNNAKKTELFPTRCVANAATELPACIDPSLSSSSSSEIQFSSSSEEVPSSSSSEPFVPDNSGLPPEYPTYDYAPGVCPESFSTDLKFKDKRDNKEYRYKIINGKAWMLKNLNYSDGETRGWCYNSALSNHADNANCNTYGRHYDWATLMNLPGKCNSTSSADPECAIEDEHQGICPGGWHVSNAADWNSLVGYNVSLLELQRAGNYDVSEGEWSNGSTYNLLGVAREGFTGATQMYITYMATNNGTFANNTTGTYAYRNNAKKTELFPIRCVADADTYNSPSFPKVVPPPPPLDNNAGTLTDCRDGEELSYSTFGNQIWMIENLKYNSGLYNWNTAKSICPIGWHLPTNSEWEELKTFLDDDANLLFSPSSVNWWSDTDYDTNYAEYWYIESGFLKPSGPAFKTTSTINVRCIKDNE